MTQFSFPFLKFRNFTGFDLTTRDLYFTILIEVFTNHFLAAENTYFTNYIEWTEQKIMTLILAKKYQIIQQCHNFKNCLINDFQHSPFLYQAKGF